MVPRARVDRSHCNSAGNRCFDALHFIALVNDGRSMSEPSNGGCSGYIAGSMARSVEFTTPCKLVSELRMRVIV